jgi:hypothetical protein
MAALASSAWIPTAMGQCADPPGDVTQDGTATVVDVQCVIIVALWTLGGGEPGAPDEPTCVGGDVGAADIDCSASVDVTDAILDIQLVLGQSLDPSTDGDGNGCPDACDAQAPVDCCDPTDTGGCAVAACEACVCDLDAYCCDTAWDALCVGDAAAGCAPDCGCDAPLGDCCAAHEGPGCSDATCSDAVCATDAFCCAVSWDGPCVACAATGVGVGGADCADALAACSCPAPGACCVAGECLFTLGSECAALGGQFSEGVGCGAGVCPEPPGCPFEGGACLQANGTPGCNNVPCCELVCTLAPSCCTDAWDLGCAQTAQEVCDAPRACCTDTGCSVLGTADCLAQGGAPKASGSCADGDGSGTADACEPPPTACCLATGCQVLSAFACDAQGGVSAPAKTCADKDGSGAPDACEPWACCVEAGCTLAIKSACVESGGASFPGFDCSDGDGDAAADVCQDAGCCASKAPDEGCPETPACEACVCGIDDYCCTTAWDGLCASCAAGVYCGSPPTPSAECASACACAAPEPLAACCTPAGCALLTSAECVLAGGAHAPGIGCKDSDGNLEPDVCEVHACCTDPGCQMLPVAACLEAGDLPGFGFDCADGDGSGAADACEP